MKKTLFLTLAVVLGLSSTTNAQERKWFLNAEANVTVMSVDGESASSVALGVGVHRMLGQRFSLGVNLTYVGAESVNAMEVDLAFAYYGRITDSFYYVPQLVAGPAFFFENNLVGFGAAVSPFGLEFRPTPRLGFRTSIINLAYLNFEGTSIWNFKIAPGLSMIFRF